MITVWQRFKSLFNVEPEPNDATKLAVLIADAISEQTEIDSLGDTESVCFMESLPTVNLVQLAERLIEKGVSL